MAAKNPKLADDWKSSRIRSIASSIKNFKGCSVKYAYDKTDQLYSVKVDLKGKPYVLTVKVGKDGLEMLLTDLNGNLIEHVSQNGSEIQFTKND